MSYNPYPGQDVNRHIPIPEPVATPTPPWASETPAYTSPLGVVKIAAWVPVTNEILQDAGWQGPLAKMTPEAERYRRVWHQQERARHFGVSGLFLTFYSPPPWESPDPPALPIFTLRRRHDR